MADTDLPSSGSDAQVRITVDGALAALVDVTSTRIREITDEIITKPIGTQGSKIDHEFSHYEGELELAESGPGYQDIQDAVAQARANRVPVLINLVASTAPRDGQRRRHLYRDLKFNFEERAQRGSAKTVTLSWKCGNLRQPI